MEPIIQQLLHGMEDDSNITHINTWNEYASLSHNQQAVGRQFEQLLWSDAPGIHELKTMQRCCHNSFKSQQSFLNLLCGYIRNESSAVAMVRNHDRNKNSELDYIKTGICIDCIQKFLIKTNGLNDVFQKWINSQHNKSYRMEFNNTNIILCDEPLFVKSILLESNINLLTNIFKLFFISYLKTTNLKKFINGKKIEKEIWSVWDFHINDDKINRCHSLEHSLSSLSTTIVSLLPLLKLFHIKHLFIADTELNDVANIINNFGVQYSKLKHIKLYKDKSKQLITNHHRTKFQAWNYRINTDREFAQSWPYWTSSGLPVFKFNTSDLYYHELYQVFSETKHPFIQRIGHIISSLYQHFTAYKSRLKKKLIEHENDMETKYIWNELRKLRNTLKYIAFGTKGKVPAPSINDFCDGTAFENICKVSYFYSGCFVSNKQLKLDHNKKFRCSTCHKSQNDFPSTKWKICGGCKLLFYCSRRCQKYDWSRNQHDVLCKETQNAVLFDSD